MIRAALCATTLFLATAAVAGNATEDLSEKSQAMAMFVGALSAQARRCGLDWQQRVFLRYTAILRREGLTEPQVTRFSALHGASMALAEQRMDEPCTTETRAQLEELLPD